MFYIILNIVLVVIIFSISKNIKLSLQLKKLEKANEGLKMKVSELSSYPRQLNYENDLAFLIYVINFKIENVVQYLLKPSQISVSKIIKDEQFEEWKEIIIEEVLSTISEPYYKLLTTYFTEEGLDTYITELVNYSLMQIVLQENFKK